MPFCQALLRLTWHPEDTAADRHRKEIFVPIAMTALPLISFAWAMYFTSYFLQAYWFGCVLLFITFSVAVVVPFATRRLSIDFVGVVFVVWAIGMVLTDVTNAASAAPFRTWPVAIIIMDVYLALNIPRVYQYTVLTVISVWIVAYNTEDGYRLGLYDIPTFTEDGGTARERCTCADPPCASGLAVILVAPLVLFVIYCDFFATRSFAEGVRTEQRKVWASVEVAERVAAGLVDFDLEEAASALDEADVELPPRLAESFRVLIKNLASYRPYLPHSVFEESGADLEPDAGRAEQLRMPASTKEMQLSNSSGLSCTPGLGQKTGSAFSHSRMMRSSLPSAASDPDDATVPGSPAARSRALSDSLSGPASACGSPRSTSWALHVPQSRRVALLSSNCVGFLAAIAQVDQGKVSLWIASEVEHFAVVIKAQGGVADLLSGDHLSASFGAVRTQGTHRASAAMAAVLLSVPPPAVECHPIELQMMRRTTVACCGRALCGDHGSASSQRFMVLGGVSAFLPAAERCAAAWGTPALIDSAVQADTEHLWSCRLRKLVSFPKLSRESPIGLWEVVSERLSVRPSRAGAEWMYELAEAPPNPWEPYNEALQRWAARGDVQDLLDAVGEGLDSPVGNTAVAAALIALREYALSSGVPAVGALSPASFAGDPAPLCSPGSTPPVDVAHDVVSPPADPFTA
eukprot:TRINITY_DN2251_c2_g2_i1.p1 TRINITY_DN2251_c2_g2~~TRINITY_DN2251_c2_g2_i1.p1  ORF type:complete len:713 (+),score=181.08 TRINITY_DN2251_c2_g2_i1:72-2141(+)